MCDTNSGHGSFAQLMINDYIKDEVPKAPILLYSLKNSNTFNEEDQPLIADANQNYSLNDGNAKDQRV